MSSSRFCWFGAFVARRLYRRNVISICTAENSQLRSHVQSFKGKSGLGQYTMLGKCHSFSTTVDASSGKGSQQKETWCRRAERHFCRSAWHSYRVPNARYISLALSNSCSGKPERISVTFVDRDGEDKQIKVPIGMSMLEAAHENDIELEGACEASLACSTCHVIVMDMEYYDKLESPTDEENDMLDLAFGLTDTSRLGCQVIAKAELDGIRLAIPTATRNFAVDGYVPKPH